VSVRIGDQSWTAEQWEGLKALILNTAALPAGTVLPAGEVEA
jgi:hypothetical protein